MRVLVLGANGQLGSDIVRLWRDPGIEVVPAARADAGVTDLDAVAVLLERVRPDVTLNTAAFHNLPACEQEPDTCFRVNVTGGLNVARAAKAVGSAVVQFSTDYVFDGTKGAPYVEDDARRAVNVYGASKVAAEDVVAQANPEWAVVRVSGLYGLAGSAGKGGNFVETMLRLAREGQPLRVVSDQVTAPTNTAEIAEALLPLVRAGMHGVYHLEPEAPCSWHEFAAEIFASLGRDVPVAAITAAEFGAPFARPAYSYLASTRVPHLRHWREGLVRYLREKGHLEGAPSTSP